MNFNRRLNTEIPPSYSNALESSPVVNDPTLPTYNEVINFSQIEHSSKSN